MSSDVRTLGITAQPSSFRRSYAAWKEMPAVWLSILVKRMVSAASWMGGSSQYQNERTVNSSKASEVGFPTNDAMAPSSRGPSLTDWESLCQDFIPARG